MRLVAEVTSEWHILLGLPKWNAESVLAGLSELWTAIAPRPKLGSGQVLNQSCSSRRELSNAMLHSSRRRHKEVDSRILVVGSQIANLTPNPSFAHNLGCRCLNGQCEAIFDIYVSRPFQWHQAHPNARCFSPCYRALNIRESRRTPNLQLFQVLGFTPTLGQSGVATRGASIYPVIHSSIRPVIHSFCHGLFTLTRWRKSRTSTHQRTSWPFYPWDGLHFFIQP
jgi:hypothetical protein